MGKRLLLALLGLTLGASASAAEPFFQRVEIFPPDAKHCHASCVVETANGDLLAVWYRGSGERSADDVEIQGAWLKKGNVLWGPRFQMADTPGYPDCNPAIFAAPDKTLWLFWPTILDHHWEGALLKYAVARDEDYHSGVPSYFKEGVLHVTPVGFEKDLADAVKTLPADSVAQALPILEHWAERAKQEIYQRLGWMPRVHVTVLKSGRWLLPLYTDTFSASIALFSDDQGATWKTSRAIISFGGIQPSFVERKDGSIVAYMRDNGPFHKIRASESKDGGETWSPTTSTSLPNPGAGVEAIRLASGRWAMVYNDTVKGRHSLALSLSDDEGKTWNWTRHVERQPVGQGSFHYPSLMQSRDGRIHVTYTHKGSVPGSTIEHAVTNEDWILAADSSSQK